MSSSSPNGQPKYPTLIQNYFIIQDGSSEKKFEDEKFFAFQEPIISIPEPRVSLWEFLPKDGIEEILKFRQTQEIKKYLESLKMERFYPKGNSRKLFINLMYSVAKFCRQMNYTPEKCGALMSQFYLTHVLVSTAFEKSADKVYTYFKELSLCHTLPDYPIQNTTSKDGKRDKKEKKERQKEKKEKVDKKGKKGKK